MQLSPPPIAESSHTPDSTTLQTTSSKPALTVDAPWQRLKNRVNSQIEKVKQPAVLRGGLSLVDQAVVSGTNFATSVIIGRLCSADDMGVYYLALSIVYFVRGIQEQVTCVPYMVYHHKRNSIELPAYTGSSLIHQAAGALLAMVGLCGFGLAINAGWGPVALQNTIWVLVTALPLMLLREYLRQLCFAHFRMTTAVILDIGVATLQVGSLVWLGVSGMLTIPMVYAVMAGACGLTAAVWFTLFKEDFHFRPKQYWTDWKENWSFARWAVASQLVGSSTPYILPWFVVSALGAAETGLLAVSNTLVGLANMFVMGIANFLTPQATLAYSQGGTAGLKRVMRNISLLFTAVLGSFFGVVLFWGDVLVAFVYGPGYAGAGSIVAVAAAGLWATSMALTAGNGLCAMDRPSANFRADVYSLIATIASSAFLIPTCGALGAAWSALIGVSVDATLRFATLAHCFRHEAADLSSNDNNDVNAEDVLWAPSQYRLHHR